MKKMHGYASRSTWQVWKLQTRAPKLQYRTVWNCESAFNAPQMGPASHLPLTRAAGAHKSGTRQTFMDLFW
jgi:hypothetical protein